MDVYPDVFGSTPCSKHWLNYSPLTTVDSIHNNSQTHPYQNVWMPISRIGPYWTEVIFKLGKNWLIISILISNGYHSGCITVNFPRWTLAELVILTQMVINAQISDHIIQKVFSRCSIILIEMDIQIYKKKLLCSPMKKDDPEYTTEYTIMHDTHTCLNLIVFTILLLSTLPISDLKFVKLNNFCRL